MSMSGLGEEIMFWEVDDSVHVDNIQIRNFLDATQAGISSWDDANDWFAVRVKVSGGNLSLPMFLTIWGEDEYGNPELWDGEWGAELNEGGDGRWGSGHFGTQSSLKTLDDELMEECIFQMELGHATWDDFYVLAYSDVYSQDELANGIHTYERGSIAPPGYTPWMPTQFYTINPYIPPIPEPSISLLVFIGIGLLGLKRKYM